MRRKQTQHIKDVLREFRRESPYTKKLLETEIISLWPKMLGPTVANSTRNLFIQNKCLFVQIDSSVMRHELFMMRSQILEAYIKQIGPGVIDNIVFR